MKAFLAAAAAIACLSACSPSNNEECLEEASKRPTDAGVKLARQQCWEKFGKAEDAAKKAKEQAEARATSELATEMVAKFKEYGGLGLNLDNTRQKLGKETKLLGPHPCSVIQGDPNQKPTECVTGLWELPTHAGYMRAEFGSSGGRRLTWSDPGFLSEDSNTKDQPEKWGWYSAQSNMESAMNIAQIKRLRPYYKDLDDEQIVDLVQKLDYPDWSREAVASALGVTLHPRP